MKPKNILLEGITGSVAYGLATENSDVDVKGIYLLSTKKILSLNFNPQKTTIDHTNPDWVYYEIGRFMQLVSSGNPTLTEVLFLNDYTVLDELAQRLVDNRNIFLSTKAVINAYGGYTRSQALKLTKRQNEGLDGYDSSLKNRFAKHTRHLVRLMIQGKELLQTGNLTVRVTPEQREYIFACGELPVSDITDLFIELDDDFRATKSVLPDEPDMQKMNELLWSVRRENM